MSTKHRPRLPTPAQAASERSRTVGGQAHGVVEGGSRTGLRAELGKIPAASAGMTEMLNAPYRQIRSNVATKPRSTGSPLTRSGRDKRSGCSPGR